MLHFSYLVTWTRSLPSNSADSLPNVLLLHSWLQHDALLDVNVFNTQIYRFIFLFLWIAVLSTLSTHFAVYQYLHLSSQSCCPTLTRHLDRLICLLYRGLSYFVDRLLWRPLELAWFLVSIGSVHKGAERSAG